MSKKAFTPFRRFWKDEQGVALAYLAVLLIPMMGMAALAIDVGHAYFWRQQMQTAADAAAYSGQLALQKKQNVLLDGKAVAASFTPSFVDGADGVTVTINCNDTAALQAGYCAGAVTPGYPDSNDSTAVEAIITRPVSTAFAAVVGGSTSFDVGARAVSRNTPLKDCMLATKTTGVGLSANGSVTIGRPDCGIAVNSASNPATNLKGGSGTINSPLTVTGAMNKNGNNFSFPQGYTDNTGVPVADPYVDNGQNTWVIGTSTTWTTSRTTWNNLTTNWDTNWNKNGGTSWKSNTPTCGAKKNNDPDCTSGSCPASAKYCTVTATAPGGSTHYVTTLGAGGALNGAFYVDTVSDGTLSNGASASYVNTVNGGTLSNSANSTFYANTVNGGTLNNSASGVFYVSSMSGGTLNNNATGTVYANTVSGGALSNGVFYINTLSGGALSNGVFYVNSLSGSVTATNATLVVIGSADIGNSSLSITAPTSNIGAANNKGLALVSPNAITISFGGNGTLRGAIYAPNTGSSVVMKGDVDSSCAQIIAGSFDIRGNVSLATDGTCGVTDITQGGSVRLIE
ncbi:pilus assembly protein TadG-related protein [Methylocystis sp. JAN1]|uniref:pilus assembly protein TadG-related protein n=1 Tax=Methylocystis sp. JAN1 TaxID=3397211 RepID=UPI003FA1CF7D